MRILSKLIFLQTSRVMLDILQFKNSNSFKFVLYDQHFNVMNTMWLHQYDNERDAIMNSNNMADEAAKDGLTNNNIIQIQYTPNEVIHFFFFNFGTNTRNRARPRTYSKLWSA